MVPKAKQLLVGCFPDAFLPGTSPWKRAFLGSLVGLPFLLAFLLTLALYFFQKQRRSQGTGQAGGLPPGSGFAGRKVEEEARGEGTEEVRSCENAGLRWALETAGECVPSRALPFFPLFRKVEGAG